MKQIRKIKIKEAAVLNSEEMKHIFGGSGTGSSCTVSLDCAEGGVSCTSLTGNCSRTREEISPGVWVYTSIKCDDQSFNCSGLIPSGSDTETGSGII